MKTRFYIPVSVAAVATALSLAACTPAKKEEPSSYSEKDARALKAEAERLRAEGLSAQAAEKEKAAADHFARLGELLLMPEGAQYADEMFAQALQIDPRNAKANFYKSATEPLMTLQGFIPRIERLITSDQGSREMERLREEIAKLKMPEVSRFAHSLPEGEKAFLTYHDVQRFLREKMLPALLASVEKLNRIDTSEPFKLNFTPRRTQINPVDYVYDYRSYSSNCTYDQLQGWKCTSTSWSSHYESGTKRNEFFVDKHDITILKSSLMGLVDQLRLTTAYGIKDAEYALRRLKALDAIRSESGGAGLTARDAVQVLREFPDLFVLERDHQLAEIARHSSEALKNGLELASMRAELCDSGSRDDSNSLIHPICVTADLADLFQLGVDLLAGPKEITLGRTQAGETVTIVIDIARTLQSPPKDLKALLPVTFDAAGEPVNYPDPTMGGLFPNSDLIQKLKDLGSTRKLMKHVRKAIRQAKEHI